MRVYGEVVCARKLAWFVVDIGNVDGATDAWTTEIIVSLVLFGVHAIVQPYFIIIFDVFPCQGIFHFYFCVLVLWQRLSCALLPARQSHFCILVFRFVILVLRFSILVLHLCILVLRFVILVLRFVILLLGTPISFY